MSGKDTLPPSEPRSRPEKAAVLNRPLAPSRACILDRDSRQIGRYHHEFRWFNRFGHMRLKTGVQRAIDIVAARERGQRRRGNLFTARQLPDATNQFIAVVVRHADVAQQNVRVKLAENTESFEHRSR